jgi:hypothetical protein
VYRGSNVGGLHMPHSFADHISMPVDHDLAAWAVRGYPVLIHSVSCEPFSLNHTSYFDSKPCTKTI